MPQHITLEEVKAACRKAYDAGRLTAQHPNPKRRVCVYSSNDGLYHCAIGCALSKETLAEIRLHTEQNDSIEMLVNNGARITTDDLAGLTAIQNRHDVWANGARGEFASENEDRDLFLDEIDYEGDRA